MSQQNQDAIFYPEKGKILINAQFYTFWISPEEFKKYNLEYLVNNNSLNNRALTRRMAWDDFPATITTTTTTTISTLKQLLTNIWI